MTEINDVWEACANLDEILAENTKNRADAVKHHLELIEKKLKYTVPDFKEGLEWLNTESNLSLKTSLKGKIVVLDFFTYCCVNCLHVLPDLEKLEEKFSVEDGVAIIGVHSAKFENEKVSANILSAVLRYNIHHPVVNDSQAALWSELQISCWPTFVIVGPDGQFLHHLIGEGHRQELLDFVTVAKEFYAGKGQLSDHSLPMKVETQPDSPLLFPGKVCCSADGKTVVVADTGHHRILVTDEKGVIKHIIGSSRQGFTDGIFADAQFHAPQGVALHGTAVYIADTENHAIRKANLETGQVETLAGTGRQGEDKEGGKPGAQQELSTPWDVCLDDDRNILYIAMAGTHQIWAYFLQDTVWYKNESQRAGTCVRFAGSGLEENRNNSYPDKASFAQPSGLAWSKSLNSLFVADSESSSVRCVQLKDGSVKNVVGGDIDPRNLFAYGDIDDTGTKAKLQHPLGVAMATEDGPLLVADSYNHKIKTVDLAKRKCLTLLGTGKPGAKKGDNLLITELNEPGGVCADKKNNRVYIADTNNHDVKVLELESHKLYSLPFISPSNLETAESGGERIDMASRGQGTAVVLQVETAPGVHLNDEAPNAWTLYSEDEAVQSHLKSCGSTLSGELKNNPSQTLTHVLPPEGGPDSVTVFLKLDLFVCEDSGVCRMDSQVLKFQWNKNNPTCDITFHLKLE